MAVEFDIQRDSSIEVTKSDVNALKRYLKEKFKFHISDKGARKVVKENRILANEYLKKDLLKKQDKDLLKIELEMKLADKFTEYLQRKIKIPENVLKSYYYDHREDYKQSDEVTLERIRFKNFDEAMKFYNEILKQKEKKDHLLKKYHGKVIYKGTVKKERLKNSIQSFLKEEMQNTYLPPMVLQADRIDVYYVHTYQKAKGYKPYIKVKKEIENILYKRTFNREREKILSRYSHEGL